MNQSSYALTDILDPKLDEKPPPYECSRCTFTTWSWTEAKNHSCGSEKEAKKKASRLALTGQSAAANMYASITTALLKTLLELLQKANDASTGEFRESIISLPSEPGRPLNIHIRRGPPDKASAGKNFSVSLEIIRDE